MSLKKKVHYNEKQLLLYALAARFSVLIAGRGMGKTEGPISLISFRNMMSMPRSVGGFMGQTYTHLLSKLIPGVVKGWENLGYKQNLHYWFDTFPPKKYKLPKPYRCPLTPKFFFSWYNGSGAYLLPISTLNNTLNLDWLVVDEARFIPYEKFREVRLAVRGSAGASQFGHLSAFKSILLATDRPRKSTERWVLDYKDKMTPEYIEGILKAQHAIYEIRKVYQNAKHNQKQRMLRKIEKFNEHIEELRKKAILYMEASTLDNVHVLGLDTIREFKNTLSEFDFRVSVLNEEVRAIENGFYGSFDSDKHGYHSENEDYIMNSVELGDLKSIKKDCRWDSDLIKAPLAIALDHNIAINCLVIGQYDKKNHVDRIVNSMNVEHPLELDDLLEKFCQYYDHFRTNVHNVIHYYYDHTSKQGRNAAKKTNFIQDVTTYLRRRGWKVIEKDIGMASLHVDRYKLWVKTFKQTTEKIPKLLMNKENNEDLIISLENAGSINGEDGFQKDKAPETKKDKEGNYVYDQKHTTHFSEALDIYWTGKYMKEIGQKKHEIIPAF